MILKSATPRLSEFLLTASFPIWPGETPTAKKGGLGEIKYPLVGDVTKQISKDYDVLADFGVAFRGLFLIDKEGIRSTPADQ